MYGPLEEADIGGKEMRCEESGVEEQGNVRKMAGEGSFGGNTRNTTSGVGFVAQLEHQLESWLLCFQHGSLPMCLERQQKMAQALSPLPPMGETWMYFQVPSFNLVQPQQLWPFGE